MKPPIMRVTYHFKLGGGYYAIIKRKGGTAEMTPYFDSRDELIEFVGGQHGKAA